MVVQPTTFGKHYHGMTLIHQCMTHGRDRHPGLAPAAGFLVAAEAGSLGRAAAALGASPP